MYGESAAPGPRSTGRPLRILVLEDVSSDVRLLRHHLYKAGLTVDLRVADREAPFRDLLAEFDPQVVLADERMPRFSGHEALEITREFDPLVPVILVTGALSDEVMPLLSVGFDDYVLKDGLDRLGPAISNALRRSQERRHSRAADSEIISQWDRFLAVTEASGDAIVVVDDDGFIVFSNRAAELLFGEDPSGLIGRPVEEVVPGTAGTPGALAARSDSPRHLPPPSSFELRDVAPGGVERILEATESCWFEGGGLFRSLHLRDITARRDEARTRLVLSRAMEQTSDSVVVTDLHGTIEWVNPAFERLTGYTREEAVGQNPRILQSGRHPTSMYEELWDAVLNGRTFAEEFVNRRKDGSEYVQRSVIFPVLGADGTPDRLVAVAEDVTQERALERQLVQAQKMEAIGQLAGGIAHDFNNVLTGILANAQLTQLHLAEREGPEVEYVSDIVDSTRRGAQLVRRLMALVRAEEEDARDLDVTEVVGEAIRTIRRLVPENVGIDSAHLDGPLWCHVDDNGLHQALLNLATNARDAMPRGGSLTVTTHQERVRLPSGTVGPCAVLTVADTGSGMAPDVLARVFDPFFTTKEVGRGTGLGLSMVQRFATAIGGDVRIDSLPGRGTRIELLLPLVPADRADPVPPDPAEAEERPAAPADTDALPSAVVGSPAPAPAPAPRAPRPRGRALVAEDQDDIRRVAGAVLEHLGFEVRVARDAVEAIRLLEETPEEFDLVVSDLVMPGGGGAAIYRHTEAWIRRPRYVFMSGYAADVVETEGHLFEVAPFLRKPWSIDELQRSVEFALESL